MHEICHRCQGELPDRQGEDAASFCPHCSAPQIRLPEHMRTEGDSAPVTTGAVPPPRVNEQAIDWRAALRAAAIVAAIGAVASVVELKVVQLAFFSMLWVLGSGAMALNLYVKQSPRAWISAKAGWRIGLVTGLLLIAAKGVSLGTAGVVARFQLHSMGRFDDDNARAQKLVFDWMGQQNQGKDVQTAYAGLVSSPEIRAGSALAGIGFQAGFMLLIAGAGGAFAGSLRTRRIRLNAQP